MHHNTYEFVVISPARGQEPGTASGPATAPSTLFQGAEGTKSAARGAPGHTLKILVEEVNVTHTEAACGYPQYTKYYQSHSTFTCWSIFAKLSTFGPHNEKVKSEKNLHFPH